MGLRYVGGGNWLPGVPARDLEGGEVAWYGGESVLISSGLYELETKAVRGGEKNKALIPDSDNKEDGGKE